MHEGNSRSSEDPFYDRLDHSRTFRIFRVPGISWPFGRSVRAIKWNWRFGSIKGTQVELMTVCGGALVVLILKI